MIRILIADDHVMFRQGLVRLLETADDIEIVDECSDGGEALKEIRLRRPDVALLDVSMPVVDGISVASLVARDRLQTRLIILTMHDDPSVYERAKKAGVQGFVIKDEAFEKLLEVVRVVAAGCSVIEGRTGSEVPKTALTERELQVLTLISHGCTNRMIALELGISIKTVDSHRTNLMNKLDLHSTAELVRYALKAGLI